MNPSVGEGHEPVSGERVEPQNQWGRGVNLEVSGKAVRTSQSQGAEVKPWVVEEGRQPLSSRSKVLLSPQWTGAVLSYIPPFISMSLLYSRA